MKLLILSAVLLVLGTVESTPALSADIMDEDMNDMAPDKDDSELDMKKPPSQYFVEQMNKLMAKEQENEEENEEEDDGAGEGGTNGVRQEDLKAAEFDAEVEEANLQETQAVAQSRRLRQGSVIGLQTYDSLQWLGCAGNPCGRASCPRMMLSGHDYNRCWGEVFQIFRQKGNGEVRSGDVVGIYFPRAKQWVGCAGAKCGKSGCPGPANVHSGFQTKCRWERCWGEVFRIYKRGAGDGAIINSGDKVAFFYVQERKWLAQGPGHTQKLPCLGTRLPPHVNQYDGCAYETFTIEVR